MAPLAFFHNCVSKICNCEQVLPLDSRNFRVGKYLMLNVIGCDLDDANSFTFLCLHFNFFKFLFFYLASEDNVVRAQSDCAP